jgi:hypothetical protein
MSGPSGQFVCTFGPKNQINGNVAKHEYEDICGKHWKIFLPGAKKVMQT